MPGHVYKRGGVYWIKFYDNGKAYYLSAKTEKEREAKTLLSYYLGQVARGEFKGFEDIPLSMQELFDNFEADCKRRKLRGVDIIGYHLKPVRAWFAAMRVDQVTELELDRYVNHRLRQGRKESTVNREMQYLLQSMRLAKRKKLIKDVPHYEKFSEKDNVREGFFEESDFQRLVACLPEDLQDYVRFGYLTGWRKNEITQLRWQDVEEDVIRLRHVHSKNKDGRVLVLAGELAEIIARRRAVRRDDLPWVFFRINGAPVRHFARSWTTACRKAGLPLAPGERKTFHDFRRTTARELSRAGVPDRIAMSIMGHRTRSMYDRYNIVNEEDIRDAMSRVARRRARRGYNTVTVPNKEEGPEGTSKQ